jgi:hypothetical protein
MIILPRQQTMVNKLLTDGLLTRSIKPLDWLDSFEMGTVTHELREHSIPSVVCKKAKAFGCLARLSSKGSCVVKHIFGIRKVGKQPYCH